MALTGAAAVRLYDDHVDAVHALIARRVGPVLSPDLTAEAFTHALRSWDRFDRERGSERLFLFGAATAIIRKYPAAESAHLSRLRTPVSLHEPVADPLMTRRARERRARVVDHDANADLHTGAGQHRAATNDDDRDPSSDELTRAMQAVTDLSPDDRDILLLTLWERCSQSQVAEVLGVPIGTVRSSLGRIRRDLKAATDDDGRSRR